MRSRLLRWPADTNHDAIRLAKHQSTFHRRHNIPALQNDVSRTAESQNIVGVEPRLISGWPRRQLPVHHSPDCTTQHEPSARSSATTTAAESPQASGEAVDYG
ncbi:uncharacterized protein H6S33_007179 [Morchella sextelata]|uniref:uncharacterized protein n=1 Tax=Morchella sextelata TaxID=1174677 RepID=UPI001D0514AC|nr:uncharacterized protein H6S33_007179 [Morchella sextelata]KAH0604148.1 hypothetical protein H6S33_007179 [Morchella sextelata]